MHLSPTLERRDARNWDRNSIREMKIVFRSYVLLSIRQVCLVQHVVQVWDSPRYLPVNTRCMLIRPLLKWLVTQESLTALDTDRRG